MNIGFSAFMIQGGRSGVASYIRELLRHLQQEDPVSQYDIMMPLREADQIKLTAPNFQKSLYSDFVSRPAVNIAWHNTVLPLIGKIKKFDLLHVPGCQRIPLVKKCPVIATVHDVAMLSPETGGCAAQRFHKRLIPRQIRNADHVITVSHYSKKDLVERAGVAPENVTVLHSGINHGIFRPMEKKSARTALAEKYKLDRPFIIYVSRLEHPAKNHIRLIEAFERFKAESDSPHRLVLPGADGNGAETIRTRAASSPVHDDILFPGYVPAEDLPLFYSTCDLMAFPSLFEGFGLPIIEALACGAPVICSNTSSMRAIAGSVAAKFNPHSITEIFLCMEKALTDGCCRESRLRGMEYAAEFDWSRTARQTLDLYERTAGL